MSSTHSRRDVTVIAQSNAFQSRSSPVKKCDLYINARVVSSKENAMVKLRSIHMSQTVLACC